MELGSALLSLVTEYDISTVFANIWLSSVLAEGDLHSAIKKSLWSEDWKQSSPTSVTPTPVLLTKPRRPAARFSGADTVLLKDILYSSPLFVLFLGFKVHLGLSSCFYCLSFTLVLRIKPRAWYMLSILSKTKLNIPPHHAISNMVIPCK